MVDLKNKDIRKHIKWSLSLPHGSPFSPYTSIPNNQFCLYRWAKAYEELEPIATDHEYDMFTTYLQRQQAMFPDIWEEVSLACFRDGSWQHTGMFINDHDPEDEEWL